MTNIQKQSHLTPRGKSIPMGTRVRSSGHHLRVDLGSIEKDRVIPRVDHLRVMGETRAETISPHHGVGGNGLGDGHHPDVAVVRETGAHKVGVAEGADVGFTRGLLLFWFAFVWLICLCFVV